MRDQTRTPPTRLRTCNFCGHVGLAWYRTKAGRWVLCDPLPQSEEANPHSIHGCFVPAVRQTLHEMAVARAEIESNPRVTRSFKPSEYRRRRRRR
jgi:hypothetical protein